MTTVFSRAILSGARLLRARRISVAALFTLAFACLLTLASGCGPTERQRVQTVSDQFLDALTQEDWNRAKPLLTEKARDAMGSRGIFTHDKKTDAENHTDDAQNTDNYTVGEPKIDEATAAVPVTLTEAGKTSLGTLRLRREDGEWRVRALRIEGENDSPGITLDFENPEAALIGATFRALGEGMGEVLKGFEQGMDAFLQGVQKGAAAIEKSESVSTPGVRESPETKTEEGDTVKIEEHTSGS